MERVWLLKRNCSLSPAQALRAYGVLAACVLAIGAGFACCGYWPVLACGALECGALALALALLRYTRHAADHERIALSAGALTVERVYGDSVSRVRLAPGWTRVVPPSGRRAMIGLEACGVRVEVGSFIGEKARRRVALELRQQLRIAAMPA